MKEKKKKSAKLEDKGLDPKHIERFNAALFKLSQISVGYQEGRIKHYQYGDQMDALISASGWTQEEFQEEIENRRLKMG